MFYFIIIFLIIQICIGSSKTKLQFVIYLPKMKFTNIPESADTYRGSFALFYTTRSQFYKTGHIHKTHTQTQVVTGMLNID